jgi:hypothetical protein
VGFEGGSRWRSAKRARRSEWEVGVETDGFFEGGDEFEDLEG